jgi:cellulose synthase/poly-beta-1,6-N-acetylglucosamine synthase-like glycosyltransferase
MNDEQIKKILEDTYDESRENTLRSMLKEFYNKKMLSVVILVWFWAIIFIAGAVYSGIQFFNTDQTQRQIMFAAIFIVCWQVVGQLKGFAWLMIHKNSIKREIKRLEFRIVELSDIMKNK